MFLIWTTQSKQKVYSTLAPVLQASPGLEIEVKESWQGLQPKVVLALGKEPLEFLASQKLVAKNRTITSLRGQVVEHLGSLILFSYSPGVKDNDYGHYIDLLTDVSMAVRLYNTGSMKPVFGNYRYVSNFDKAVAQIKYKYSQTGKPVETAIDLETLGLDEFALPGINPDTKKPDPSYPGAYIVSIQLSHEVGTADVLKFDSRQQEEDWLLDPMNGEQLGWLLTTPMISNRGANFKYDLRWLAERAGQTCTNFKFDTTLVGSLLDENRSNGLDVHAKIYVPRLAGYSDEFDRTANKARMDLEALKRPLDFLNYAGGDPDATLEVSMAEKAELLADPVLTSFYVNIMHPAARAFENVERGGILIDTDRMGALASELDTEMYRMVGEAKKILGGRIVAKHADPDKPGGMNITKASLIKDYMFSPMGLNLKPQMVTEKTKEPSSALEHLLMFKDVPEASAFVGLLSEYSSASKTKSTFVDGFLDYLRSDCRFHPSFWFFAGNKDEGEGGTNTGRLSCKGPAFQTLPKHTKWAKKLRKCYIAPPGHLVMERDYSQGELRVVACIANEENMIEAYRKGMDLHALTSGRFSGYSYEEMMALKKSDPDLYESIRQLGKAGNFGLLYGMGVDGFYVYAVSNYGVKDLTLHAAELFRNGFFETYPGLLTYHSEYKNRAKRFGCVYSPLGRIRHLPMISSPNRMERSKAERQAINSPVQSTLSDMLVWSVALEHKAGLSITAPCFGACHDAAYNYVPENRSIQVARDHVEVMENLPFHLVGWSPQLKFVADAKIGPNMADLDKVKF
jgi:DNA polymerase I-like protein with 3'-5' exonuclease and polymerase domains